MQYDQLLHECSYRRTEEIEKDIVSLSLRWEWVSAASAGGDHGRVTFEKAGKSSGNSSLRANHAKRLPLTVTGRPYF